MLTIDPRCNLSHSSRFFDTGITSSLVQPVTSVGFSVIQIILHFVCKSSVYDDKIAGNPAWWVWEQ